MRGFGGGDGGRVPTASPGVALGATDEEVHKPLPGDGVVPHPMWETTHTVTIDASAEEIWPWLVQMGHYRAGFYADPS